MKKLPKARSTELVENDFDKEILIYDLKIDKVYSLNETSKIVYLACDGQCTFEELKKQYKFTDDLIHFALDELNAHNLLEDYADSHFSGLSRREIIRRVGLISLAALPVIAGITAPAAAQAASGAACNTQCTCSVANNNPTFLQFCEEQLRGQSFGCNQNVPSCECNVAPNSNIGICMSVPL